MNIMREDTGGGVCLVSKNFAWDETGRALSVEDWLDSFDYLSLIIGSPHLLLLLKALHGQLPIINF